MGFHILLHVFLRRFGALFKRLARAKRSGPGQTNYGAMGLDCIAVPVMKSMLIIVSADTVATKHSQHKQWSEREKEKKR